MARPGVMGVGAAHQLSAGRLNGFRAPRDTRLEPRGASRSRHPPDADGWMSQIQAGASYRPFMMRRAIHSGSRLRRRTRYAARRWPAELGANRVHVSEVTAWYRHDAEPVVLPVMVPNRPRTPRSRAPRVGAHPVRHPDSSASDRSPTRSRASSPKAPGGEYGIHTRMISDGVMYCRCAGKVANRKPLSTAASASDLRGSAAPPRLPLARRQSRACRILPVTDDVNGPASHASCPGW